MEKMLLMLCIKKTLSIGMSSFVLLLGLLLVGCSGQIGALKFFSKNYLVRVETTLPETLEKGQTVEVFSKYIESENASFSMERLETHVLQQLVVAGYTHPEKNQSAHLFVLIDRNEIRRNVEHEATERKSDICGQDILEYLDDGYSAANDLPADFLFNARQHYDSASAVNKRISTFSGKDERTVQQKELDKVCTTMSRTVIRQKVVVEDRLILSAVPSAEYFTGNPRPPVWRIETEGPGGMAPLLVAAGRALNLKRAGQWEEVVATSASDYIKE